MVFEFNIALKSRTIGDLIDLFDLLLDFIDLVVKCLFFGIYAKMSLLERHGSLVEIGGHRNSKKDEKTLDTRNEHLTVVEHQTLMIISFSNIMVNLN